MTKGSGLKGDALRDLRRQLATMLLNEPAPEPAPSSRFQVARKELWKP